MQYLTSLFICQTAFLVYRVRCTLCEADMANAAKFAFGLFPRHRDLLLNSRLSLSRLWANFPSIALRSFCSFRTGIRGQKWRSRPRGIIALGGNHAFLWDHHGTTSPCRLVSQSTRLAFSDRVFFSVHCSPNQARCTFMGISMDPTGRLGNVAFLKSKGCQNSTFCFVTLRIFQVPLASWDSVVGWQSPRLPVYDLAAAA